VVVNIICIIVNKNTFVFYVLNKDMLDICLYSWTFQTLHNYF